MNDINCIFSFQFCCNKELTSQSQVSVQSCSYARNPLALILGQEGYSYRMEQEYIGHSWASQERSLTFWCLSLQSYKRKIMRLFVYKGD